MVARSTRLDLTPRPVDYPLDELVAIRSTFAEHRQALVNYLERREHHGVVSYVAARQALTRIDLGLHHSPNESAHKTERITAAALGCSPGYPDLIFHRPFVLDGVAFSGLAIELKRVKWTLPARDTLAARINRAIAAGKDSRANQRILNQWLWLERLRGWGRVAEFARGACEAIALVELCYGVHCGPRWPVKGLTKGRAR